MLMNSATYSSAPILNLAFAVFFSLTTYFYTIAMIEDPGYVPKISSRNQQREMVKQLFELWKFDEENFCVPCMSRKPLRSRHCRRCGRCVAKHDQYVPKYLFPVDLLTNPSKAIVHGSTTVSERTTSATSSSISSVSRSASFCLCS